MTTTIEKLIEIENMLDFYEEKKVFLKSSDVIDICRFINNSQNDHNYIDLTVSDAIKNNQWDTCNGTMGYNISIGDKENRYQVFFDGRRCFVKLDGGIAR